MESSYSGYYDPISGWSKVVDSLILITKEFGFLRNYAGLTFMFTNDSTFLENIKDKKAAQTYWRVVALIKECNSVHQVCSRWMHGEIFKCNLMKTCWLSQTLGVALAISQKLFIEKLYWNQFFMYLNLNREDMAKELMISLNEFPNKEEHSKFVKSKLEKFTCFNRQSNTIHTRKILTEIINLPNLTNAEINQIESDFQIFLSKLTTGWDLIKYKDISSEKIFDIRKFIIGATYLDLNAIQKIYMSYKNSSCLQNCLKELIRAKTESRFANIFKKRKFNEILSETEKEMEKERNMKLMIKLHEKSTNKMRPVKYAYNKILYDEINHIPPPFTFKHDEQRKTFDPGKNKHKNERKLCEHINYYAVWSYLDKYAKEKEIEVFENPENKIIIK